MRAWLRFVAVLVAWSVVGRGMLATEIAHPYAIAGVWAVGLIWLTGWAVGSVKEADYLLKIMAGMISVPLALLAVIIGAQSMFN